MSQTNQSPQQQNKWKRNLTRALILLIIIAMVGSFSWFIVWPALIGENNSKITTKSENQSLQEDLIVNINFTIDELSKVYIDELGMGIPSSGSRFANACVQEIRLIQIRPFLPENPDDVLFNSYQIEFQGDIYNRIRSYKISDLCIKDLRTSNNDVYRLSPYDVFQLLSDESVKDDPISRRIGTTTIVAPYYYPFDQTKFDISFSLRGKSEETSTNLFSFPPKIRSTIIAKEWVPTYELQPINDFQDARLIVKIKRPLSIKALFIVIIGTIFIASLLLIKLESTSSVLEVAVGILFSIWGVQEIIKPDYVTWTTIIDSILSMLYMVLAFALFVRFFLKPLWFRYNPPTQDETPPPPQPEPQPIVIENALPPNPTHLRYQIWSLVIGVVTAVSATIAALIALLYFNRRRNE